MCYRPLKGFVIGKNENNKQKIKIMPYDTEYVITQYGKEYNYIKIPCGKCIECRLAYSRQWANRCLLELQNHAQSWFCTLTYDEQTVPINDFFVEATGEVGTRPTLKKEHLSTFMKDLRSALTRQEKGKVRFFGCGEYGSTTGRPHYHVILFGLELDDLKLYRYNSKGFPMYNSAFLDNVWKKGYVVVEHVTWETCAYVARYVTKKLSGVAAQAYKDYNYEPEFVLMSRRPGIGRQYLEDHFDQLAFGDGLINISTPEGGRTFAIPSYFQDIICDRYPEHGEKLRIKRRQIAEDVESSYLDEISDHNDLMSQLRSEELATLARTKSLVRDL